MNSALRTPWWITLLGRSVYLAILVMAALSQSVLSQTGSINNTTQVQVAALMRDKEARTPAQNKISSHLLDAAKLRRDGFVNQAVPDLRNLVVVDPDGRVRVDITANVSAQLLREIRATGGTILGSYPRDHSIRAILPLEKLEDLSARVDVRFIRPEVGAMINTGSVDSEGDVAHQATVARTLGATGAGVTVGVLSDSIDDSQGSFAAAVASGDIDPNNTYYLTGQAGTGEAEGLAMLEIVHDLAPSSVLFFATANGGDAQMAQNIRDLAANGCKVIIDDYSYFDESPFQDGTISQAVNDVSDGGVLYFSSARNSGNKDANTSGTWEGDFADGGDASGLDGHAGSRYHAFSPGVTKDAVSHIDSPRADLFWSDPLGGSANDYDLYVVNSSGSVVDQSTDTQDGTQDPYEDVGTLALGESLIIVKYSGASRFIHLDTGRCYISINTSGNVRGHNASGAPNAFSVAAISAAGRTIPFTSGTTIATETFSSDGPRRIFYNADGSAITPGNFSSTGGLVLQKPDITAADGVKTTLPGSSGLNPFYGTSAAAPHAGAIAAQVLSRKLAAAPPQVHSALISSALDIEASGFDRDAGAGIVMAPGSLSAQTWNFDFNADGKIDILWQNTMTGQRLVWLMNGLTFTGFVSLPFANTNWSFTGSGDFSGDGQPDILLQNKTTGQRLIWLMDGTTLVRYVTLPSATTDWSFAGSGDFDGNAQPDILLQNTTTGQRLVWLMNGTIFNRYVALPSATTDWSFAGAGDFDRDGHADILLQNTKTGQRLIWLMNGTTFIRYVALPFATTAWSFAGAGDFDDDGNTDILLQNTQTGQRLIWIMKGTAFSHYVMIPSATTDWSMCNF
ncbi:MAG TPA: FG-GAP-like repeat-containing protein [Chthoniobacterales bacterium]